MVTQGPAARRVRLARPGRVTMMVALILVLCGAGLSIGSTGHRAGLGLILVALLIAVPGLLIVRRQPRNPIGWLLLGYSALLACYEDAADYSVLDYRYHHGRLPLGPGAVVIASELWSALFLMLPLVILLFPDGRLPSRWRVVLRAYLAVCVMIIALLLSAGAEQVSSAPIVVDGKGQLVNNPGPGGVLGIVFIILAVTVLVFWASFVVRQVLSWRRVVQAGGERQAQLKWLMAGGAVTVIGLTGTVALQSDSTLLTLLDNICLALAMFSLPVCISFAILKYHLYDIDRVISRTLSYTLVTGLLIGVYAGAVTFATRVLPFTSPVAVAASTLAAAALFNPLRRRVQRAVDRRFNRARYDADRMVAAFAARLKDAVDLNSVRHDLASVVHEALEPAHVAVWVSRTGG